MVGHEVRDKDFPREYFLISSTNLNKYLDSHPDCFIHSK